MPLILKEGSHVMTHGILPEALGTFQQAGHHFRCHITVFTDKSGYDIARLSEPAERWSSPSGPTGEQE